MFNDPLWFYATYVFSRARLRARAALDGNPESGALSLEWIVIAGFLVAAAAIAYAFFKTAIDHWESKMLS